jgi:hypothetical protein
VKDAANGNATGNVYQKVDAFQESGVIADTRNDSSDLGLLSRPALPCVVQMQFSMRALDREDGRSQASGSFLPQIWSFSLDESISMKCQAFNRTFTHVS